MPNEGAAAGGADNAGSGVRIPPYISFATFLTFLGELKTNGMPPQIDISVLRRFSGGVQSQLKMAIKSLGLVEGTRPTKPLIDLVEAYETPEFEPLLQDILTANYPYVFALDLMTATPTMFADAFKVTGAKEDVSRKCRTFFLHAAKRAGVPIGQRIANGVVPRAPSAARKPKVKREGIETPAPAATKEKPIVQEMSDKALEYKLVDLMKDEGIEAEERAAIWTLIQYLTAKAKAALK